MGTLRKVSAPPSMRTGAALLVVLASIGAAAGGAAPSAAAARSCGDAVLQDWADGKIDRIYQPRCYRDALDRMPADLRIYGSADTDIRAAMLRAEKGPATQPSERTLAGHVRGRAVRAAASPASSGDGALSMPLPLLVAAALASLWGAAGAAHACIAVARRRRSRPPRSGGPR